MSSKKVLFFGDGGVGKTQIIRRATHAKFSEAYKPTIGVDFALKQDLMTSKGTSHLYSLQLWDTAGLEKFKTQADAYTRKTDAFVLVFDITNRKSFEGLMQRHLKCREYSDLTRCYMVVLGNKIDAENRTVSKEEAEAWSSSMGMHYMETSALTEAGIEEAFTAIAKGVLANPEKVTQTGRWTTFLKREILSNKGEAFSTEETELRERLSQTSSEVKLDLKVGDVPKASTTGLSIRYHTGAEASELAQSLGIEDKDILCLGLTFEESDVLDAYKLGELSARMNACAAHPAIPPKVSLETKAAREGDKLVLRVLLKGKEEQFIQTLLEALTLTQGATFNADLNLSEGHPSNKEKGGNPSDGNMQQGGRVQIHLECKRNVLSILCKLLQSTITPPPSSEDTTSEPTPHHHHHHQGQQQQQHSLLQSAMTLKRTRVKWEFDDSEKMWLHVLGLDASSQLPEFFNRIGSLPMLIDLAVKNWLLPALHKKVKKAVVAIYKDFFPTFSSVRAAHIVVGSEYVLEFKKTNL